LDRNRPKNKRSGHPTPKERCCLFQEVAAEGVIAYPVTCTAAFQAACRASPAADAAREAAAGSAAVPGGASAGLLRKAKWG